MTLRHRGGRQRKEYHLHSRDDQTLRGVWVSRTIFVREHTTLSGFDVCCVVNSGLRCCQEILLNRLRTFLAVHYLKTGPSALHAAR